MMEVVCAHHPSLNSHVSIWCPDSTTT